MGITLAAGGTQNLNGVVFTDTLPAGAQFVSATGGGTFANGVVTWPPRDMVPNPNADVTVLRGGHRHLPGGQLPRRHEDPQPRRGQRHARPVSPTQELGRAQRPGTIGGAGTVTGGSKKDTLPELGPGQTDTYTLTAENPNATPLAGFHVLETLPPQLAMVQDGPNLTGTGPAPVSITATPGGNVPINGGGGLDGDRARRHGHAAVRLRDAPPNFLSTILVQAGIPANGIDRNGQPDRRRFDHRELHRDQRRRARPSTGSQCTTQTIVPVSVEFSKIITSSAGDGARADRLVGDRRGRAPDLRR